MGKQRTETSTNKRPVTPEEYEVLFKDFPDVMDVKAVMNALNICRSSVYTLMKSRQLAFFTVGRVYKIAKISLINYVMQSNN